MADWRFSKYSTTPDDMLHHIGLVFNVELVDAHFGLICNTDGKYLVDVVFDTRHGGPDAAVV